MMWRFDSFGDRIAVISEDGSRHSYAQLNQAQAKLAGQFKARCFVFCLCQNSVGSLLGYATFINHRILPLLLDASLDRALLDQLVQSYKPDYLWVPEDKASEFPAYQNQYSDLGYSLLKTEYDGAFPIHDDLALLLTTSGSTGSPKLVRQSYRNIRANIESIVEYLELDETERPITTLPMSYTYGLSILNSHFYVGASIIMTQMPLTKREFWQQFRQYEATSFGGVPYIYEMLDKLRFFRMDLPSLRTVTQAGGKLAPELHKKLAEYAAATGRRFVVMYGQTEATARMAYLPYEKSLEKYGSMGIVIPGGKFSLIDVEGNGITEPEITGELVYEGANVTLGYAESGADLIKGDEFHGRLVTGDMAKRDADGYYYIVGRKKRFLKIFGSRINLDETERMVKAAFPDLDCACGGVDDKMHVFITDGLKASEVLGFLTEKTGFNHIAFTITAVEVIPKNEAGKTLYAALEKYYR